MDKTTDKTYTIENVRFSTQSELAFQKSRYSLSIIGPPIVLEGYTFGGDALWASILDIQRYWCRIYHSTSSVPLRIMYPFDPYK